MLPKYSSYVPMILIVIHVRSVFDCVEHNQIITGRFLCLGLIGYTVPGNSVEEGGAYCLMNMFFRLPFLKWTSPLLLWSHRGVHVLSGFPYDLPPVGISAQSTWNHCSVSGRFRLPRVIFRNKHGWDNETKVGMHAPSFFAAKGLHVAHASSTRTAACELLLSLLLVVVAIDPSWIDH